MYIVISKIKSLAKSNGKRVSRTYLEYLSRRVHAMVVAHAKNLGSRATLNAEDAGAMDASRLTSA